MWEVFRDNFGPSFTLWTSLDAERRAELDEAMEAYFEGYRTGDGISVERRYIVVTGVRKQADPAREATRSAGTPFPRR